MSYPESVKTSATLRDTWGFYRVLMSSEAPVLGRQVAEGALEAAYARGGPYSVELTLVDTWTQGGMEACRGIIAPVWSEEQAEAFRAKSFPVVNVSNSAGAAGGLANFLSDDEAVGRMAADHLTGCGYRGFLGIGLARHRAHAERLEGFSAGLAGRGQRARLWLDDFAWPSGEPWSPTRYGEEMAEWLRPALAGLGPATGIFATNDWLACLVQRSLERFFPDLGATVGVLGVDNQQREWYHGRFVGLSSIEPGFREAGAAAMDWLQGRSVEAGKAEAGRGIVRRFAPRGVVARASTAVGGCADPETARMMRWAWERLQRGEPLSVGEMAARHGLSTKTLERRFGAHAGATASETISRLRLELARHLLRDTRAPITEIAARCGYAKHDVLSRAFLRFEGCTPRDYRKRHAAAVGKH